MSAPTVPVTCRACDSGGNPVAGAIFRALLDKTEVNQGYIVPERIEVIAGADGIAVLNLWPNALGVAGSLYRVVAFNPDNRTKFLDVTVSVPNSPCNLHEILTATPAPSLDAAQQAVLFSQQALALATTQADIAATKADEAEVSALAAANAVASIDHQFAQLALSLVTMQALAMNPYAFN